MLHIMWGVEFVMVLYFGVIAKLAFNPLFKVVCTEQRNARELRRVRRHVILNTLQSSRGRYDDLEVYASYHVSRPTHLFCAENPLQLQDWYVTKAA